MSMPYSTEQQVMQDFSPERSHFLENGKTGFFCFIGVGEAASILKICPFLESRQCGSLF